MTVFQQARRWIYTQVSVVWTCQGSGLFPTASPGFFLPFCLLFLTYDRVNCGDWANLFGGKPCNQVPRRKIQLISIINQITARRMWAGQPVAEVLGAFWLGCFCSVLFRPENVPVRSFHALIAAAPPFFLLWRPSFITVCLVVRQTATQTFPPLLQARLEQPDRDTCSPLSHIKHRNAVTSQHTHDQLLKFSCRGKDSKPESRWWHLNRSNDAVGGNRVVTLLKSCFRLLKHFLRWVIDRSCTGSVSVVDKTRRAEHGWMDFYMWEWCE